MAIFRNFVSLLSDSKGNRYLAGIVITASLVFGLYFLGSAFTANSFKVPQRSEMELKDMGNNKIPAECKKRCRSPGSEAWPEGIIAKTSDLDMQPLWGSVIDNNHSNRNGSLLAIAAGIKQKDLVDKIFLERGAAIIVFHYDGVVDQWNDLGWSKHVIHVSAVNQTKWWFAKRFLHPDIVAEYEYVFLWDEDLRVENFDPARYLSIIKEEGLDISQPALDPVKSEIHHQITIRRRNSKVHRSYTKFKGGGRCYANSTGPPCLGWVEMMAPVFSKAAWRCAWELIQNDLIHAWGIDFQLGYCAQGDRKKRVGVVDAEYIVHLGVPTLGAPGQASSEALGSHVNMKNVTTDSDDFTAPADNNDFRAGDDRSEIRRQSYIEMRVFWKRWYKAVEDDKCWVDRYKTKKKKKCILGPCRLENTTSQMHHVNIHP